MAYVIGNNVDTAPEFGDVVTSGVDESEVFYGFHIDTGGTAALKSPNGTSAASITYSAGDMIWGLALIGYTGTAVLRKLK